MSEQQVYEYTANDGSRCTRGYDTPQDTPLQGWSGAYTYPPTAPFTPPYSGAEGTPCRVKASADRGRHAEEAARTGTRGGVRVGAPSAGVVNVVNNRNDSSNGSSNGNGGDFGNDGDGDGDDGNGDNDNDEEDEENEEDEEDEDDVDDEHDMDHEKRFVAVIQAMINTVNDSRERIIVGGLYPTHAYYNGVWEQLESLVRGRGRGRGATRGRARRDGQGYGRGRGRGQSRSGRGSQGGHAEVDLDVDVRFERIQDGRASGSGSGSGDGGGSGSGSDGGGSGGGVGSGSDANTRGTSSNPSPCSPPCAQSSSSQALPQHHHHEHGHHDPPYRPATNRQRPHLRINTLVRGPHDRPDPVRVRPWPLATDYRDTSAPLSLHLVRSASDDRSRSARLPVQLQVPVQLPVAALAAPELPLPISSRGSSFFTAHSHSHSHTARISRTGRLSTPVPTVPTVPNARTRTRTDWPLASVAHPVRAVRAEQLRSHAVEPVFPAIHRPRAQRDRDGRRYAESDSEPHEERMVVGSDVPQDEDQATEVGGRIRAWLRRCRAALRLPFPASRRPTTTSLRYC